MIAKQVLEIGSGIADMLAELFTIRIQASTVYNLKLRFDKKHFGNSGSASNEKRYEYRCRTRWRLKPERLLPIGCVLMAPIRFGAKGGYRR